MPLWEPIGAPEKVTYGNNSLAYTGSAFKGVLAGAALSSTVENVKVNADIDFKGTIAPDRFTVGGIAGFASGDFLWEPLNA